MLTAKKFQQTLLAWFQSYGRNNLPWQENKTPYRVWISEIMLQQTQVSTVIPYYQRFMQHFPNLETLSLAKEDDVLHLWAGLGYYSRARNLHRAAKMIMRDWHGHFPNALDEMTKLPGIGESTAGAILSIAFNTAAPILDGNVKRVLTRIYGIKTPINQKETLETLWQLASSLTPTKDVADYTQAIMDFGATLCTRTKPACNICPFKKNCLALKQDEVALIPDKTKTKRIPTKESTFLIIASNDGIYLQKRPNAGIWGGLWCVPELQGKPNKRLIQNYCRDQFAENITILSTLPTFKHTFTHFHLNISPILLNLRKRKSLDDPTQIWYNPKKPAKIGLPKPVQSIMRKLISHDTKNFLHQIK